MKNGLSLALVAMLCVSLVTGCATEGMSIPIGDAQTYAPTVPEYVSILVEAPTKPHKVIALVDGQAATDDYLSTSRTQAAAVDAMRKEAARLGSHAIVLTARGSKPYAQITTASGTGNASAVAVGNTAVGSGYYNSTATTMGYEMITVSGTAIRYEE